jgi:hypothetical protein
MQYVYILSFYNEYGLEAPIYATTDRSALPGILRDKFSWIEEAPSRLTEILKRLDEELCVRLNPDPIPPVWWNGLEPYIEWFDGQHRLVNGWGGLQLLVVRLEPTK